MRPVKVPAITCKHEDLINPDLHQPAPVPRGECYPVQVAPNEFRIYKEESE